VRLEDRFAYGSFRPGQEELARRVYEASLRGETLVAEAMSGFGKTAAVLAGTLAAAEETGCRVVYACRTKRQIHRVLEEAARLQGRHGFGGAALLSKYDYCLLRRQRAVPRESFGWYCTFNVSNNLCSYFMNVTLSAGEFEDTVAKVLRQTPPHHELVREAESMHLCPYEVARLAVLRATVAVAPYQYVFDPRAALVLFDRNLIERNRTILVVDEAHNLRDFFRGLQSATLNLETVRGATAEAEALLMMDAADSLRALGALLEELLAAPGGWMLDRLEVLGRFKRDHGTAWLQNLAFELSASSGAAWGSVIYERRLPSLILRVGEFLTRLSSSDGAQVVKWDQTLGIINPDPVEGLQELLSEFKSAILVSATISPSEVFKRSLGLTPSLASTYEVPVEPQVSVRTAVDIGTSTRYKLRTPEMFSKIADKVAAVINATEQGVGVFVPSYALLDAITRLVARRVSQRHMVAEAPGLSNEEASEVYASFRSGGDSVLFAVQGGRFSEGEDFSGDSMGSVAVVGMSLPPPTPLMYAEYACLKRAGERDSYLMLSRLPALRKAFQAAGRHIRSPGKKGLVFLFDERFNSAGVRELMPSWLRKDLVVGNFSPASIGSLTRDFWESG